ncbi:hypothetical protein QUF72_02570 [Desulfobacterales bacterium HSG2]|nr:hypothetical protein [Desulfobacterales bacterium HSG2]
MRLKKVNLSQYKLPDVKAKDNIFIPAKSLHEAWRYGKELEPGDERKYEEKLQEIMQVLDSKLR